MALLGAHVSVAGGAHKAFVRGAEIGCDALQIFVRNPNRWDAKALADADAKRFREAHAEASLPVIAHAGYLINLCSSDDATLAKSRAALADELARCDALGVPGLVLHPGAHLGAGEEAGLDLVARSLDAVFAEHPELEARVLLENTAGQGTVLGSNPEQLGAIVARVDAPERLGVCLDSCHAFAAGWDLHRGDGYRALLDAADAAFGLERVAAWHLNDSKHGLGEHKDRHAPIGQGEIGEGFFARVIADPRFEATPMIVETPLGDDGMGHERDLARLRKLLDA